MTLWAFLSPEPTLTAILRFSLSPFVGNLESECWMAAILGQVNRTEVSITLEPFLRGMQLKIVRYFSIRRSHGVGVARTNGSIRRIDAQRRKERFTAFCTLSRNFCERFSNPILDELFGVDPAALLYPLGQCTVRSRGVIAPRNL